MTDLGKLESRFQWVKENRPQVGRYALFMLVKAYREALMEVTGMVPAEGEEA